MVYPMFAIKDIRSNEFAIPRADINVDCAKRFFAMQVNEPSTMISFAPADFELYYVGDFDSAKGLFIPCVIQEFIARGSEMVGVS